MIINQDLNIYVNNKLADLDTKVYENFSVIWTMEELQLSDRDIYGSGVPDTYDNLPEDDGTYVKSEPKKEENVTPMDGMQAAVPPVSGEGMQAAAETVGASSDTQTAAGAQTASGMAGMNAAAQTVAGTGAEGAGAQTVAGTAGTNAGAQTVGGTAEVNGGAQTAAGTTAQQTAGTSGAAAAQASNTTEEQPKQMNSIPMSILVTVNGDQIRLEGKPSYIFVDVFDYINFDLSAPQGLGIVTELNGRNAQYMEPIHSGDVIKIYWKD